MKSVAKVDLKYRKGIVDKINDRISKVEDKIDEAVLKTRRKVAKKIPAMKSDSVPEVTLVRDVATSAIEGTLMDNLKNTRETILNHSSGKLGFPDEQRVLEQQTYIHGHPIPEKKNGRRTAHP